MKILVTGAAGFIASKISYMLAERGDEVVGIDNINDYYDVRLKHGRLHELGIGVGQNQYEWNKEYQSSKFANLRFITSCHMCRRIYIVPLIIQVIPAGRYIGAFRE